MERCLKTALAVPERIAASANGDMAAFVVAPPPEGPDEMTGLWQGKLAGTAAKLSDAIPDTNLTFAPHGASLAMGLHDSEGSTLIITDPAVPQGSWRAHHLPVYAERLAWTDGGLVMLAADPGADAASLTSGKTLPDAAQDPLVVQEGIGYRRLWRVDPATGASEPASPDGLAVWEFALVPGGGAVVVASDDPSEAGWYRSALIVLDAAGRQVRVLRESPWQLSCPTVSPDGGEVAWVEGWASDRGLLAGEVYHASLDGTDRPFGPLTADADVTWLSWASDGRLWLAGWHHLGTAWGWAGRLADGAASAEVVVHTDTASCLNSRWHPEVVPLPDGSALTRRSTPLTPPEVVRLREGARPEPWTSLNAGLERPHSMQVRELHWQAPDGTAVEGLVAEPADGSGPRPLVVDIHGGPSLAWHYSWELPWAEFLTGAGYAVLMPNPRGSAGRGQSFARANLGDPAGAELGDILAGVERCVADGVADPARIAAMGASYGGYLTAWAVAGGAPLRCGVVIAGISDLVSCWGTANNPPFYDYLLAGRPADVPARYLERSPVIRIDPGSAPALILHGREDTCVPVGQAEELYAAMRRAGVPADFVSYPREGHQVSEPAHVADQRERVLRWLGTYLCELVSPS